VLQVLQQMQRRYDTLVLHLRDAAEHAAQEERSRLAQTITSDITAALAQTEQSVASAISQAQSNLARLDATVAQTRSAAAAAVERMRAAIASLRVGAWADPAPSPQAPELVLPPDELMTLRSRRALNWSLPVVFVAIALPLALLQRSVTPTLAVLFALCCGGLIAGYVFTQRIRAPLLVLVGLSGQAAAVLAMVLVTHALPLTLGLLLVMWQIAMRLSSGQVVVFLVGVQAVGGLALARVLPLPHLDETQLLIFCVACLAVTGLVGTARRQLGRRREAEARLARLAHLTGELEQQLAQARALAVAFERTRLAREIHDDLGHRLMLINVQLQLAEDSIEDDPAAALGQLCATREQLREAWSSVLGAADAVLGLDGAGLVPAVEQLIAHCRTLAPMRVALRVIGDFTDVDQAVACALYRTVQAGLTNACTYAQARQAQLLVYCDDVEARVSVRDDGCGGVATPGEAGHFGLVGLRERAELLGGSVAAAPLPTGGFELSMTIPLP
jgi:signal transduction histidine kinase